MTASDTVHLPDFKAADKLGNDCLRYYLALQHTEMSIPAGMGGKIAPYPDESRGPLLLRITWPLVGLSSLVVLARIWTKFARVRRLYTDDICMIFALVGLAQKP